MVAAAVLEENPLPFPKKSNPSPFEIFHLPRDRNISKKEVKGVSQDFIGQGPASLPADSGFDGRRGTSNS